MRKSLVLLLLLLLFCAPPGPAVAGPFATEVTQLLNHVELVLSYAAQANQLATQIKILADAIKNTVNNPHQLFWNIQADLNALAGIVQGAHWLTRSAITTHCGIKRILATAPTRQPVITTAIRIGRKLRWTLSPAQCARPGYKASNSTVRSL